MDYTPLYRQIIEALPLKDEHRQELTKKRGFTDEQIKRLKFKSCGEFVKNLPFYEDLPKNFQDSLGKENIVIPYFDPEGQIDFIRPHKFGIEGMGVQVYYPQPLIPFGATDMSTLVLAESEFKAAASCILGVPAIGLPGIASFSKKRFVELIDKLRVFKCENVIICFDSEVKDNPAFKNYKPDYTKRYDTLLYEYIMAYKIERETNSDGKVFRVRIAQLLEEWRDEGKADIDGVLARGVSPKDYQRCLASGVTAAAYRSRWSKDKNIPPIHQAFIERKIDKHFYEGPVKEEFKCYKIQRREKDQKVSNFVIRVIHTLQGEEGAVRYCRLESLYGNSKPVMITPAIMSSKQAFIQFCYEQGDYEFTGEDKDLRSIWHYVFLHQDGKVVKKLTAFGFDEESGAWFFQNGAYHANRFYPATEEGIVWIGDKGYKIFANLEKELDTPMLTDVSPDVGLPEILAHMDRALPPNYARTILGWALGAFFMPEILANYGGSYPFLFLSGKTESGKSTIANWVSAFYGMKVKGFPIATSSVAGITRICTQMSCLPVWLEEYRASDPDVGKKNNFFRTVYDRSTTLKATKNPHEIKGYKARAALILSGEEHSVDKALNSRCIMLNTSRNKGEGDVLSYRWLQANRQHFAAIGHKILEKRDDLWKQIKERMDDWMESFAENEKTSLLVGDRARLHTSIIGAIGDVLIGENETFNLHLGTSAVDHEHLRAEEQALYIFYRDIANFYGQGKINFEFIHYEEGFNKQTGEYEKLVRFWFTGLYGYWERELRGLRDNIPASRQALFDHIKKEPYYLETRPAKVHGQSKTLRCVIFNYANEYFPDDLRDIVESVRRGHEVQNQKNAAQTFNFTEKETV